LRYAQRYDGVMAKPQIGRRWLPLNALRAFESVAKHGSFTAAAHALQISSAEGDRGRPARGLLTVAA